jgi:hypothetical protein
MGVKIAGVYDEKSPGDSEKEALTIRRRKSVS